MELTQRAKAAWAALRKHMSDTLRAAVNTKTGRPIPAAVRASQRQNFAALSSSAIPLSSMPRVKTGRKCT